MTCLIGAILVNVSMYMYSYTPKTKKKEDSGDGGDGEIKYKLMRGDDSNSGNETSERSRTIQEKV